MESRLRVACAIGKMEEEIRPELMKQVKMALHRTKVHQQCQVMEKVHIRKHGETWGKYQSMVDEEHHQHSLNQERLAMPSVIKKRKGGKLEECTQLKLSMVIQKKLKQIRVYTAYIERTNLDITNHEWTAESARRFRSQKSFVSLMLLVILEDAIYNFYTSV